MQIITGSAGARIAASSLALALLLIAFPTHTLASTTPTLTAATTVSNVAASSIPTVTTAGGIDEVKATRTLVVANALPAGTGSFTSVNFTIGDCVVSMGTGSQDVSCADHAAFIATTTDTTAAAIVTRLLSVTGIADTGHGALASTASSTNTAAIVFTTSGTEAAATNITYTASTATNVTSPSYATVTGVVPVAATVTVVITGALGASATDHSVNVDSLGAIDLGTSALTAAQVAAAIRSGITGAGGYGAKNYTVSGSSANVIFTRKSTGTAGNAAVTLTDADYGTTAQQSTFTPANPDRGKYTITINDVDYDYSAPIDATIKQIVEGLQPVVDGSADVSCTEDDTAVTCTASVAGTAFTYDTNVEEGSSGSGTHHGSSGSSGSSGGGGGSSSSSVSTSGTMTIAELQAKITALIAQATALGANVPVGNTGTVTFMSDLTVGSTGEEVRSLQVWLNTHGFNVAASGAGSSGSETTMFGGLTQAALAKFQASVGIMPSVGYFGPKTRAYIAAHP